MGLEEGKLLRIRNWELGMGSNKLLPVFNFIPAWVILNLNK